MQDNTRKQRTVRHSRMHADEAAKAHADEHGKK